MRKIFWILSGILPLLVSGCAEKSEKNSKESPFEVDARVDSLMKLMSLSDKVGQLVLYTSHWDVTGPVMNQNSLDEIKTGMIGNVFNAHTVAYTRQLQRIAVEESPRKIPLLFGYDVIHGHKTIFPLSLGEASSWDMEAIEKSARISAIEAAASGINWTFAPMCDISVEPRWGRVSEGAGEDPFLGSCIAQARVRGFQGKDNNLADPFTILACVKHFAAYGAPYAGRDYNMVDMSQRMFLDFYLPPYVAGINQGAMSVMASFNDFDFVPATSNKYLQTDLLRTQLGFEGFVVTDYTGIPEIVMHGTAPNDSVAGEQAIKAGIDMDMEGGVYHKYLINQVKSGAVSESLVDDACRRVLRVKFMLGLFDDPYKYMNEENEKKLIYSKEHLQASYDVAVRSMVLLKNEKEALPLKKGERLAVIGELANSQRDLLGSWKAAGDWAQMSTILDEIKLYNGAENVVYAEGAKTTDNDRSGFDEAMRVASNADKIVYVLGENWEWTGEAASRTDLSIPGVQTELLEKLAQLKKPIVLVLMNGRPLTLVKESELATAMLEAWYPGTMGGKAVNDVLFGVYNPSGKLPMTFPRNLGQVPIFYWEKSTGRPVDPTNPDFKYKSRYIDSPNSPLYKFGFGLSYTQFTYSDLKLSGTELSASNDITATVTVTNSGKYDGEEVVQVYYHDLVASVTRPLRLLCAFQKVMIKAGESKQVSFTLKPEMFAFHNLEMQYGPEPGDFNLFVGGNLDEALVTRFTFK